MLASDRLCRSPSNDAVRVDFRAHASHVACLEIVPIYFDPCRFPQLQQIPLSTEGSSANSEIKKVGSSEGPQSSVTAASRLSSLLNSQRTPDALTASLVDVIVERHCARSRACVNHPSSCRQANAGLYMALEPARAHAFAPKNLPKPRLLECRAYVTEGHNGRPPPAYTPISGNDGRLRWRRASTPYVAWTRRQRRGS
jgi:hypothetical protein